MFCISLTLILVMVFVNMGAIGVEATTAATPSTDVPRNESVWMAGYWNNGASSMNPFIGTGNDYSGVFFMYLPLFDTNSQIYTDYLNPVNLVPLLGLNANWNIDGSKLTVNIRPQAIWSDNTSVTANDVVFSLQAYTGTNSTAYKGAGIFKSDLAPQIHSIVATSRTQVQITLNNGYNHSEAVYEDLLIGGAPVVPLKVFQGKSDSFTNNWFFDTSLTSAMKIVDGPYMPYASTSDGHTAVNVRWDNWWMAGIQDSHNLITWRIPQPKYIVSYVTPNNFDQDTALANGQIDLFGSYVANIGSLINGSTQLNTWFEGPGTTQFFPLTSAMNEVVFNYLHSPYGNTTGMKENFPLDTTWLHKALASAINYQDVSNTAASGYISQASATWLDSNQPAMREWYNSTIASKWAISSSVKDADAYMQQGAYLNPTNNMWYTTNAPVGAYYAFSNQTIVAGNDAGGLNGGVFTSTEIGDQDPSAPGINLPIGSWQSTVSGAAKSDWFVYCVDGWTDHMASLNIITQDWNQFLGINIRYTTRDYGTMINNRDTRNFGMYYSSLGNKLDATPQNFFQYFAGTSDVSRNVTQWTSQNYWDNLTEFSTAASLADQKAAVNNLQYILGEKMPAIPVTVNCYWYVYSDAYWQGWPNGHNAVGGYYTGVGQYASRSDYVPVTTHWTTDHFGHDLMILNNLVQGPKGIAMNSASSSSTGKGGGIPWDLPSILIGLSTFALASVIIRKKVKKT